MNGDSCSALQGNNREALILCKLSLQFAHVLCKTHLRLSMFLCIIAVKGLKIRKRQNNVPKEKNR